MYPRVSKIKRGHKTYQALQIVESIRKAGKPTHRVVAHLGPLHAFKEKDVDQIIDGLCRIFGRKQRGEIVFERHYDFGDVFAILSLWKQLKFAQIVSKEAKRGKQEFVLEEHLKILVINRCLDPKSKLGLLLWLEGVYLPGVDRGKIKYPNLLRTMDWLIKHKIEIENQIANEVLTLFDQKLDLVFYDLTSSYFEMEGIDEDTEQEKGLRKKGYSRDKRPDLAQVTIGMVMTKAGIPLAHYVFPGNTPDKTTLIKVIRDLKKRFPIKRCVFVGDRAMLTEDNIQTLKEEKLEYIVGVPLRQHQELHNFLPEFKAEEDKKEESYWEKENKNERYIVKHDTQEAKRDKKKREEGMRKVKELTESLNHKLQAPERKKGRKLTPEGVLVQVSTLVRQKNLTALYDLRIKNGLIKCELKVKNLEWEEVIDGKIVLMTNTKIEKEEVVQQYQGLQEIEYCFRTLKSSLDIRPMFHWTPRRIKAHIFICIMALQILRVMQVRFRKEASKWRPERALEKLRQIKAGIVSVDGKRFAGVDALQEEHKAIYQQLEILPPTAKEVQALKEM